jgi:hypothetical protein
MAKASRPARRTQREPFRFAHPFFTAARLAHPANLTQAPQAGRMLDFIHAAMGPVPPVKAQSVMALADIIGAQGSAEIQNSGSIRFHAVGDTGRVQGASDAQEDVTNAMTSDYHAGDSAKSPAFFLHLGDIIYGPRKQALYRDEFYRPYMKYPGKIIAIPGNHDGEMFKVTDPVVLEAFIDNFCAAKAVVPPIANDVRIFRETMTQPGIYWLLKAPFVNVVGLYSNIAEGPGDLRGAKGDDKQIKWLRKTLSDLKGAGEQKALVIATHHPPFSEGGHSGSQVMLQQIDDACKAAGILPHAMLAGHTHTYQRYTRTVQGGAQIACVDAGCGGHAASAVKQATKQMVGDAIFEKSLKGFGYLLVTATRDRLTIEMIETADGIKKSFDSVSIDIAGHRVI